MKEKIIIIDKTTGNFLEIDDKMEEAKLLALDAIENKNLIVFKLQQKILKNINMQIFRENWQIISSSINLYSYMDFLKNGSTLDVKNEEKVNYKHKFVNKIMVFEGPSRNNNYQKLG